MVLVGQADGDQVGLHRLQHLVDIGETRRPRRGGLRRDPLGVATDDGHDFGVGAFAENPDVLTTPPAGSDDRDPQCRRLAVHRLRLHREAAYRPGARRRSSTNAVTAVPASRAAPMVSISWNAET